jgi:hypothetical protein
MCRSSIRNLIPRVYGIPGRGRIDDVGQRKGDGLLETECSDTAICLFRVVQNVCACLAVTLNPAEPSAQASLNFVSTVLPSLFLSTTISLTPPPTVSQPSATFPAAFPVSHLSSSLPIQTSINHLPHTLTVSIPTRVVSVSVTSIP